MSNEENKTLVQNFYKAFEANEQSVLRQILAPELEAYWPDSIEPEDLETHLQRIDMWHSTFGDNEYKIMEQIAEGNKVVSRVSIHSVHNKGSYGELAPTGKEVVSLTLTIEVIKDKKIIERRVFGDRLSMMKQLGLIP